jgi:hypothetical protein
LSGPSFFGNPHVLRGSILVTTSALKTGAGFLLWFLVGKQFETNFLMKGKYIKFVNKPYENNL